VRRVIFPVILLLSCVLLLTSCAKVVTKTVESRTIEYVYVPQKVVEYQTLTTTIETPKTVIEYIWKKPRQFIDGNEIREYLTNKPVYMPAEGQDCDDVARFFQLDALKNGYLVSQQYLPNWHGYEHMLIMAVAGNSIYYIEPQTNEYWWVSPLD